MLLSLSDIRHNDAQIASEILAPASFPTKRNHCHHSSSRSSLTKCQAELAKVALSTLLDINFEPRLVPIPILDLDTLQVLRLPMVSDEPGHEQLGAVLGCFRKGLMKEQRVTDWAIKNAV